MAYESLGQAERQAKERLNVELDAHLTLTEGAFNLICETLAQIPERPLAEVPQPRKVATALLARVSNDLRTASLLALLGYPTQALEVVAWLYEAAFTIAYIRADEDLAQRWIDHADPTQFFASVATMTREGLAKLRVPDAEQKANTAYRTYSQLCMAKHANPLYQQQQGFRVVRGYVEAFNGPDTSDHAIRAAWFALEHAVGLSLIAAASMISDHVPPDRKAALTEWLKQIEEGRKALEIKALTRWGGADPFPGKWREI